MIFSHQPKWINPIYARGGHISLKVGEWMDIGGVSARDILAMVGLNFVRTASWEAMLCIIWPMGLAIWHGNGFI
jgi:hypothetical protein